MEEKKKPQNDFKNKIAIGSDHAGFELKECLKEFLNSKKIEVIDFGCNSIEPVDYPDIAIDVAEYISDNLNNFVIEYEEKYEFHHNDLNRGILICGSGSGMCIAANKVGSIRAVNCCNTEIASLAVQHNDANILCLGARFIDKELAKEIVDAFLNSKFEKGRHLDRINKIHLKTNV